MNEILGQMNELGSYRNLLSYQQSQRFQTRPRMRNAALTGMAARAGARSLQQSAAQANRENAISYLRTADGWLQTINNMMGRMGELAVSASDGTKSPRDRFNLQTEFSQMQQAIQSITSGPNPLAQFNGIPLFQGRNIQVGGGSFRTPDLRIRGDRITGDRGGGAHSWGEHVENITLQTAEAAAEAGLAIQEAADHIASMQDLGAAITNQIKADASAALRGEPYETPPTPAELASLEEVEQYAGFIEGGNELPSTGQLSIQA
ncbi:MAG: hypothetical protein EOM20_03750 [Spartobacteria bacterium]|nr:hypothetical protein [Spartobacteria bacterium]